MPGPMRGSGHARMWSRKPEGTGVLALTALAALVWSVLALLDHHNGNSGILDLGIFTQVLWNAAHGHGLYSSVLEKHFFGEHLSFTLWPLVPLYRILPSPNLLLVLQAILIAAAAPAVWLVARGMGGSQRAALAWAAIYVLQPTLTYNAVWDFHPIVAILPLFLWMLAAVVHGRWNVATALALAALLVQEEMGLVLVGLGVCWALVHGQRRRGVLVAVLGAAWFWVGVQVVMPHLGDSSVRHLLRYAYLGDTLEEMLATLVTRPVQSLQHATTPLKLLTLAVLLGALAGLPVLGGRWILPALVPLTYNFLSMASNQFDFRAQYAGVSLPFLIVGAVHGATRLAARYPRVPFVPIALGCALVSQAILFVAPPIAARDDLHGPVALRPQTALVELRERGVPPPTEAVVATNALGAHLTHRRALRVFDGETMLRVGEGDVFWIDLEIADPWPFATRADYVNAVAGLLRQSSLRVRVLGRGLLVLEPGRRDPARAADAERALREARPRPKGYRLARRLTGRGL